MKEFSFCRLVAPVFFALRRFAFAADAPWQREFEDNFPYPETDDQLRCIADIKHDMESPTPMDRLTSCKVLFCV